MVNSELTDEEDEEDAEDSPESAVSLEEDDGLSLLEEASDTDEPVPVFHTGEVEILPVCPRRLLSIRFSSCLTAFSS